MKKFNVLLELQIDAENQQDAVQGFIDFFMEDKNNLIYIVQDNDTKEICSVDMSEENDDKVLPYDDYVAFDC